MTTAHTIIRTIMYYDQDRREWVTDTMEAEREEEEVRETDQQKKESMEQNTAYL